MLDLLGMEHTNAAPGDVGRGTLVFATGLTLLCLCWSGLVYRYVQPGFMWFVAAAAVALIALGLAVQWRAFCNIGSHHGTRVGVLLLIPLALVAVAAPGPLLPVAPRVTVAGKADAELPPLHEGINDMTVVDFPHYENIDGTRVRMVGQVTLADEGWMLTRYRVLCCAADATLHGVAMRGAVPDSEWVVVTGVAKQGAVDVETAAPIEAPERPYL